MSTVAIFNLDRNRLQEDVLVELMSQVGNIADFRVPVDDNGRPRGFAFVDFQDPRTADYASDLMNNMMLWDRRIRVENAYPITEDIDKAATEAKARTQTSVSIPARYMAQQPRALRPDLLPPPPPLHQQPRASYQSHPSSVDTRPRYGDGLVYRPSSAPNRNALPYPPRPPYDGHRSDHAYGAGSPYSSRGADPYPPRRVISYADNQPGGRDARGDHDRYQRELDRADGSRRRDPLPQRPAEPRQPPPPLSRAPRDEYGNNYTSHPQSYRGPSNRTYY